MTGSDDPFTPKARRVFSAISLLPGLSVKQVATVAHLPPSTVSHHLPKLDSMALAATGPAASACWPASWTL